nr:uncharacterized protein LOC112802005 isoform X2 [Arachis hypogaea]
MQERRRRSILAPSYSAAAAAAVDWGQGRRRRTLFPSPLGFAAAAIDRAAAGRTRIGRGGRHRTRRHQLQPSPKLGQIHWPKLSSINLEVRDIMRGGADFESPSCCTVQS